MGHPAFPDYCRPARRQCKPRGGSAILSSSSGRASRPTYACDYMTPDGTPSFSPQQCQALEAGLCTAWQVLGQPASPSVEFS